MTTIAWCVGVTLAVLAATKFVGNKVPAVGAARAFFV